MTRTVFVEVDFTPIYPGPMDRGEGCCAFGAGCGMTLDPAEVSEAWCHERGYVCMIEELHQKKVRAGESFGAAYVVGYFDDIPDMEKVYDRNRGKSRIVISNGKFQLE